MLTVYGVGYRFADDRGMTVDRERADGGRGPGRDPNEPGAGRAEPPGAPPGPDDARRRGPTAAGAWPWTSRALTATTRSPGRCVRGPG